MTTSSSVTCNDTIENLNGSKCSFSVRTVVCGNVHGNRITTMDVNLAGTYTYTWYIMYEISTSSFDISSVPNTPNFTALPLNTKILTLIYEMV